MAAGQVRSESRRVGVPGWVHAARRVSGFRPCFPRRRGAASPRSPEVLRQPSEDVRQHDTESVGDASSHRVWGGVLDAVRQFDHRSVVINLDGDSHRLRDQTTRRTLSDVCQRSAALVRRRSATTRRASGAAVAVADPFSRQRTAGDPQCLQACSTASFAGTSLGPHATRDAERPARP